jgi:hypothetical protein
MLKFSFSAAKMKKGDLSIARGHNLRAHPTESQLPKSAWLADQAHYTTTRWNEDRAETARSLAKRKDAVVGIEMTFQVGNQTDWRKPPTKQHPHGKPKPFPADFKKMSAAIKGFLVAEFGAENIVSLELHMDESTPHYHAVVTPIKDGKLNAKAWLNGPAMLGKLYERAHRAVARAVPCEYTKGGPGGRPHDPSQRAGSQPAPGLLDKLMKVKPLMEENARLKERVQQLEQVQFSRAKNRYRSDQLDQAEAMHREAAEKLASADRMRAEAANELRMASATKEMADKRLEAVAGRVAHADKREEAAKRAEAELEEKRRQVVGLIHENEELLRQLDRPSLG